MTCKNIRLFELKCEMFRNEIIASTVQIWNLCPAVSRCVHLLSVLIGKKAKHLVHSVLEKPSPETMFPCSTHKRNHESVPKKITGMVNNQEILCCEITDEIEMRLPRQASRT